MLSRAARAHIDVCAACRRFWDGRIALVQLIDDLPQATVPSDFEFRLRAQLANLRASHTTRRGATYGFAPNALSIALAAVFAGSVGLLLYLNQYRLPNDSNAEEGDRVVLIQESASAIVSKIATTNENELGENAIPSVSDGTRAVSEPSGRIGSSIAARRVLSSLTRRARTTLHSPRGYNPITVEPNSSSESNTFSARPANLISTLVSSTDASPTVAVPVHPHTASARVRVRDSRGGRHTASIDSVTFGDQELHGRINNRVSSSTPQMREIRW